MVGMKLIHIAAIWRNELCHPRGQAFFDGLIDYITSAPVVVMALEARRPVAIARIPSARPSQLRQLREPFAGILV